MSITAFEFAARLARRHANKGMADLGAAELTLVADAVNYALTETFRLLPAHYSQREAVFAATPRAVTVGVAADSDTLTSGAFLASEIGASILFTSGGDAAWHQIVATDRLRMPWGGTTGTATAQIYADAPRVTDAGIRVERVVRDPWLMQADGHRRKLCLLNDGDREAWGWSGGDSTGGPRVGTPETYFLEPAGAVDDAENDVSWLRVWPLPAVPVRVLARCEFSPARVRATHLTAPANLLPVPADCTEQALDLAGERLSAMPGFQVIPWAAQQRIAQQAAQRLSAKPSSLYPPRNRVGTPYGY